MAFIITCTTITYVIAVILLIDFLCCNYLSRKWQVILIAILLILEFALAVDVAIVASQASIIVDRGSKLFFIAVFGKDGDLEEHRD